MARDADGSHARAVGRTYTPGGRQAGLPGIDPDERLPSEQALTGEVLADRRREAMTRVREALGARPEGYAREEWAVVLATLAPEHALGPRGRVDRARQARECFPGLSAPAALRAWLEVSARPHVASVIADFRALEAVDVLTQRETIREAMTNVLMLGMDVLDLRSFDPAGAAKCGAAAAAAAKVLIDLDGLRAAKPEADTAETTARGAAAQRSLSEDPLEALARKVAAVAEDVQRRRSGD